MRETKQLELTVDGQQFRVVHDIGDGTDMIGWDSVATRFHLYSFVIGSQTLHATGTVSYTHLEPTRPY